MLPDDVPLQFADGGAGSPMPRSVRRMAKLISTGAPSASVIASAIEMGALNQFTLQIVHASSSGVLRRLVLNIEVVTGAGVTADARAEVLAGILAGAAGTVADLAE